MNLHTDRIHRGLAQRAHRRWRALPATRLRARLAFLGLALALGTASGGCIQYDTRTGEVVPRGEQRYTFDEVRERARELELGMTKMQVLYLLGSPAEAEDRGNAWVYLPERTAYVVPARALRLVFAAGVLEEFGFHPIVFGQEL